MVNLSKKKLDEDVLNKLFVLLFSLIAKKRDIDEFMNVFVGFISLPERIMIVKRIGIIYLLIKKVQKDSIEKVLGVSRVTINKFELLLETNSEILTMFRELVKKEFVSNLLDEIISFIYPPGTYGIDWRAAWERKKRIEKRKRTGM